MCAIHFIVDIYIYMGGEGEMRLFFFSCVRVKVIFVEIIVVVKK